MTYIIQIQDDDASDFCPLCKVEASSEEEALDKVIEANPEVFFGEHQIFTLDELTDTFYDK